MDELTVLTWRVPHASVADVEAATLAEPERVETLRTIRDASGARELVYIPTCQRVVIALLHASPDAAPRIQAAYGTSAARSVTTPEVFQGRAAFHHLGEVASSLDSLVVGEPQILGQVKDSLQQSDAEGLAGPGMRHIGGLVLRTAKAVRNETELFRGKISLLPLTEELIEAHARGKPRLRAAVLGTGQIGERMAQLIHQKRPDAQIHLVSRDGTRAAALAAGLGAAPHALTDFLRDPPCKFDIVACAMTADAPVLQPADFLRLAASTGLLVLDLALPRNTQAPTQPQPGLNLVQMDDLTRLSQERQAQRAEEIAPARLVLDRELARIEQEYESRKLAHDLAELNRRIEAVSEARWNERPTTLDEAAQRKWHEQTVRAILHEATEAVKKAGCRPK